MTRLRKVALVLYWLSAPLIVGAVAQIVSGLPFTLTNGTVADATQVMADFNQIVNNVNANAAKNGVNNDITALTALTTPLTVTQGGTGLATLTSNGILYGAGTGVVGSGRCTMDATSSIACTTASSFFPQYSSANSTADANGSYVIFSKTRTGGNTGNADAIGNILFKGFANSAAQNVANITCSQNGAAVGSNIPSICSVLTSTTAGQLNVNFAFPPTNGTAGQVLRTDGAGVTSWIGANPTVQRLTSGAGATYTPTSALVVRQRIRMIGGGGGGGAVTLNVAAVTGGTTSFKVNADAATWTVVGGTGGPEGAAAALGGAGGTGGTTGTTGTLIDRVTGARGGPARNSATAPGGGGGSSPFGGAGAGSYNTTGDAAATNSGSGGGGGQSGASNAGGGGGAGEYLEIWVTGLTTGTYTVGAGGAGGTAGGTAGGAGAAGIIIIEELYQ